MNLAIYLSDVSEDRPLFPLLNRLAQVYAMGGLPLPDTVFLESALYKRLEMEVVEQDRRKIKTTDEVAREQEHGRVLTWNFPNGSIVIKELKGG